MKIHKRFPPTIARPLATTSSAGSSTTRARSNSSSRSLYTATGPSLPFAFFGTPGTSPSARPGSTNLVVSTRLAAEAKAEIEPGHTSQHGHHQNSPHGHSQNGNSSGPPPYSLVFSSGNTQSDTSSSGHHLHSQYQLLFPNHLPFGPGPGFDGILGNGPSEAPHAANKQCHRYHLDVGAYGIPKHSRKGDRVAGRDGFLPGAGTQCDHTGNHVVQVGEDAYFINDNAMGVADGVGGWSKAHRKTNPGNEFTPSALFANRLMHYCYEEIEAAMGGSLFTSSGELDSSDISNEPEWLIREQLDDSLEDLADGLDVLHVLEKAFAKTLEAHVVAPSATDELRHARPDTGDHDVRGLRSGIACGPSPSLDDPYNGHHPTSKSTLADCSSPAPISRCLERPIFSPVQLSTASSPNASAQAHAIPLMEGSSTALLAVLEHPSSPAPSPIASPPRTPGTATRASRQVEPATQLFNPQARRLLAQAAQSASSLAQSSNIKSTGGAVLRIAHLGDCMAMLVRGDQIVWRTEEMWWNFNTPVQLGPTSPTRPRDARVFSVPVQQDDILILASDGLSDNLWDEDILDEVVRFKQSFMSAAESGLAASAKNTDAISTKGILGRGTLAGMLSEALCSRARCVGERKPAACSKRRKGEDNGPIDATLVEEDDIPFGRRAREEGRWFTGGKLDDISVLVAVISSVD